MNGLPDWDQMTIRDQTAYLKARLDRIDNPGMTHYEGDDCPGGHRPNYQKEMRRMAIEEAAISVVMKSRVSGPELDKALKELERALEMA
jgi:hypothetical protein